MDRQAVGVVADPDAGGTRYKSSLIIADGRVVPAGRVPTAFRNSQGEKAVELAAGGMGLRPSASFNPRLFRRLEAGAPPEITLDG
jgi:hypothetical protein